MWDARELGRVNVHCCASFRGRRRRRPCSHRQPYLATYLASLRHLGTNLERSGRPGSDMASSSSSDFGGGGLDRPGKLAPESKAIADLRLAPHEARLFLDRIAPNQWQLTDIVTLERRVVAEEYELFYADGEGGRAALLKLSSDDDGDPGVILADELMEEDLSVSSSGERFIVRCDGGEADMVSLDAALARHAPATFRFGCGDLGAQVGLEGSIMKRPRDCGMSLFWVCSQLFGLLKMSSYRGVASKWVGSSYKKWGILMQEHFPGRHILHSKHTNMSEDNLSHIAWWDRSLRDTSMSTISLLYLLAKWAYASPKANGLRCNQSKRAAIALFSGLLQEACLRDDGRRCTLHLSDQWQCRWPRPSVEYEAGAVTVSIEIRQNGCLHLPGLMTSARSPCHLWTVLRRNLLKTDVCGNGDVVNIDDFVRASLNNEALSSLAAQLLWFLARQLEGRLREASDGDKSSSCNLECRDYGIVVGAMDMEERLVQYVLAGIEESSKHRVVALATDAATPAGLHLQNTVLVYRSNHAVLCCPTVAFVGFPHTPMVWGDLSQILPPNSARR